MPCYGGPITDSVDRICELENTLKKTEAMLCAVMTVIEGRGYLGLIRHIDFEEAGVPEKEFRRWWKKHKQADRRRRAKEHARKLEEQIEQKRQEAEERKLYMELHKKYGNGNTLQGVASLIEGNANRRETPKERAFKEIERRFEDIFGEIEEDYELWNNMRNVDPSDLTLISNRVGTMFGIDEKYRRFKIRKFFRTGDKQGLLEYIYELQQNQG